MNAILKSIVEWVLARLKEPSTYTGLVTMVPALATHTSDIARIGALTASVALVIVNEARPITPAVVVEDVAPVVEQAISNAVANP
jgi:hypothetical protein